MVFRKSKGLTTSPAGVNTKILSEALSNKKGLLIEKDIKTLWSKDIQNIKKQEVLRGAKRIAGAKQKMINKAKKDEARVIKIIMERGLKISEDAINSIKQNDFRITRSGIYLDNYPEEYLTLLKKTMIQKLRNGEYKHV